MPTKANLFQASGAQTGLLVAVWLDAALAATLAIPGGEATDQLHLTLCYCGDVNEMTDVQIGRAISAVAETAMMYGPLIGSINGLLRFNASESSDGLDVFAAQVDVPGLESLRQSLASSLEYMADCPPLANHGYTPHVTLSYIDPAIGLPMQRLDTQPFTIRALSISLGNKRTEIPLTGEWAAMKAGARHSGGDTKLIQTMHDSAVALGAMCAGKSLSKTPDYNRNDFYVPVQINRGIADELRARGYTTPSVEHDHGVSMLSKSYWGDSNALKAVSKTDDELRVANHIVLFGGRDLEGLASKRKNPDGSRGEYFSKATKFDSSYTDLGVLYVDWEHGAAPEDEPGADEPLGYVDWKTAKLDDKGIFVQRVLNRRNRYVQFLEELIDEGLIGNSTEAIGEGVQKAANGEIKAWPLRRDTLTVQPMEPRMLTANSLAALKALSAVNPALKSIVDQAEQLAKPEVSQPEADRPYAGRSVGATAALDTDSSGKAKDNSIAEGLMLELELLQLGA